MGHLTLISEDVIGALEHLPPDLRLQIGQFAPQPEWDEYVTGRYKETKKKDTSLLGGGKPVVAPSMRNGAAQWKVDEADAVATSAPGRASEQTSATETKGEFKRTRSRREGSEDFGAMAMDDDDDFHSTSRRVRVRSFPSLPTISLLAYPDADVSLLIIWHTRCYRLTTLETATIILMMRKRAG